MFQAGLTTVYWFRRDLRLEDNLGLTEAASRGGVVPIFILGSDRRDGWLPGRASRWWLHHSLQCLATSLEARGVPLVIRTGDPVMELLSVVESARADAVFWQRSYEPASVALEAEVQRVLSTRGVDGRGFEGALLVPTERVRSRAGKPFRVFTPFWRTLSTQIQVAATTAVPKTLTAATHDISSARIEDLRLLPRVDWASGIRQAWQPGEVGAQRALALFVKDRVSGYAASRDFPGGDGTSRLSPHLHFGEISVATVWRVLHGATTQVDATDRASIGSYLRQLGWRDFAHHILFHFPQTQDSALDPSMEKFAWRSDLSGSRAWRQGRTGYPIVDAAMRELWRTGWMHNRVRMIVGSFLVKDLLIDWREGARWFWDTLVDADLANNTLGWQWVAGCGADAAPYFRVFNPVLQGRKFDPDGRYVKTWVPELAKLAPKWVHAPWEAPISALDEAGVRLERDYPLPIVDHLSARERALAALSRVRQDARP
jgi:deoxyribodipyrimidine photo-lyase